MSPDFKARRGFTLIELLIVIGIIGILIASVLTIVPKVKRAVYAAQTQAQLSALSNAIQQYYNDFKAYPGPLPNNQLCAGYDNSTPPFAPQLPSAYSQLKAESMANLFPPHSHNDPSTVNFQIKYITGSQNLVLGLLGGLEIVSVSSGVQQFEYNAQDIFSDGVSPAPRGPASLNILAPRRQQSYLQVKPGDISVPDNISDPTNGGSFADSAARTPVDHFNSNGAPDDAMIPVFLDKYADPLPILYYRTNPGAQAIVGFRNSAKIGGTQLTDSTTGATVTAQYDLLQNMPYVASYIGTVGSRNRASSGTATSFHGLTGITSFKNASMLLISSLKPSTPPADSIDYPANSANVPTNNGSNGLAYFKDPSVNNTNFDQVTTNTHLGVARQKDGYILISAGPDRLYGTHDDLVFPGPLQP